MSKNFTTFYTSFYERDFAYNSTSTIYWITGIVLLVVVFISSTFCIIFYFICVSKARCRRMNNNQQYNQRYQNGLPNNVFILSELDSSDTNINDANNTINKPPVYENILNCSELDRLPTYNSFRQTKQRQTILPEPTEPIIPET
jgi:hypothetical protein